MSDIPGPNPTEMGINTEQHRAISAAIQRFIVNLERFENGEPPIQYSEPGITAVIETAESAGVSFTPQQQEAVTYLKNLKNTPERDKDKLSEFAQLFS